MLLAYKPVGLTPLEVVQSVKALNPLYQKAKIAYAGRLDPMAEGLLLLLVNQECKERSKFQGLAKTYEFEVLFGVSTDTYDILGLVSELDKNLETKEITEKLANYTAQMPGKRIQSYPAFSSKAINGKKLFELAKSGKLNTIKIPSKEIEIYSIKLLSEKRISRQELEKYIFDRISKVRGDFRQDKIIENWEKLFRDNPNLTLPVYKFRIKCGSGTYVRSIAHQMGIDMRTQALALSIKRTAVGPYRLSKYRVTTEVMV